MCIIMYFPMNLAGGNDVILDNLSILKYNNYDTSF